MSQKLELPDKIYEALNAAAVSDGLTPAEWLAIQLSMSIESNEERPLSELLTGLVGVVDSTKTHDSSPTPFSTALAEKFRKQGLRTP